MFLLQCPYSKKNVSSTWGFMAFLFSGGGWNWVKTEKKMPEEIENTDVQCRRMLSLSLLRAIKTAPANFLELERISGK